MDMLKPYKKMAAVCGLFCPACSGFIGTIEDRERLLKRASLINRPVEDLECNGCRSEKLCYFCKESCIMKKCAESKGIDFCSECTEYPCIALKEFQVKMPHRIDLFRSLDRIKEVGYEKWHEEMVKEYSCPKCNTINSAYDIKCRKCQEEPSCNYVKLHKEQIISHLQNLKP
jgi:Protein of unknown function (DUF3795)